MAQKQSILGRIMQLAVADLDLWEPAGDRGEIIAHTIREYTNMLAEGEAKVATMLAELRASQADLELDRKAVREWEQEARSALEKSRRLAQRGDTAKAEKLENLAQIALGKQIEAEELISQAEPFLRSSEAMIARIREGLATLREQLEFLRERQEKLSAADRSQAATEIINDAVSALCVLDPTVEVSSFDEGLQDVDAATSAQEHWRDEAISAHLRELEVRGLQAEVQERLAHLLD